MKTIKLTVSQWQRIREQLHEEHPKSIFMIRNKMRSVLGFTIREHNQWIDVKPKLDDEDTYRNRGYSQLQIHLDFYSENKQTMFLMKFSEIINDRSDGSL